MQTVSMEISEEVMRHAERTAVAAGLTLSAVLTSWLHEGCAQATIHTLAVAIHPQLAKPALSSEEVERLVTGLGQPSNPEKEQDGIELEELLRSYRQRLVGVAQAITDWLTGKRTRDTQRQATQLVTVNSTMLYAVGYDAAAQTLDVVFNTGGIYRYFDVPPHIYRDLLVAESVGQYMWRHVLRFYPVVRLGR